jgi:hypothetical protein
MGTTGSSAYTFVTLGDLESRLESEREANWNFVNFNERKLWKPEELQVRTWITQVVLKEMLPLA